jgi:hypothetical protein
MHDPNHHEEVQVEIEELQVSPTLSPQHGEIPLYLALPDQEEKQVRKHWLPKLESSGTLHEVPLVDHQVVVVKQESIPPPPRTKRTWIWIGVFLMLLAIVMTGLIVMLTNTSSTSS